MITLHSRFLRSTGPLLAALAMAMAPSARADSPATGATLYQANCASCHGSSPLTSNVSKIYYGRNARSVIDASITSVGQMNSLRSAFPAGGQELADLAAYLGNSPTTLSFASTAVGSTSSALTVTMTASLKSGNSLSAIATTLSGDFARSGGTCGTTLAVGSSCTILVTFTPTASGARSGTLSISHAGVKSAIPITMTGTGTASTAPAISVSPTSLSFADTAIGSTSSTQNVTISNSGSASLTLSALTLSSTDFLTSGGTCVAGGSVAAGSSCTLSLAFRPQAGTAGARNGSLSITHNASGSPSAVTLAGNALATAAPQASLTASLAFGSVNVGSTSATQTATLSNTGTAALTIGTLSAGSGDFAVNGGTCAAGGSVAAGASCTVGVRFTPSVAGARSGTLTVTHNAGTGSSTSSLSGTGVALSAAASVSPTALSFTQTVGSTSSSQTVTVSNTGTAALTLGTLTLGGSQASDYAIAGGSCAAGGTVAASSSCTVLLTFTPGAAGTRSGTLSITHNATGSPSTVALNGTGTATPQPAIALNAATLSFASQALGTASAAQTVTVSNSGAASLSLSGLTLAGTAAGDFTRGGTCTATTTLAVGGSCTVTFTFAPAATGTRSATLTLASNASNGSAVLSLSGTGAAAPAAAVSLTPASLDFGSQTIGAASAARTVTLANTGSAALTLGSITADSGFSVTHNCGTSVATGASCALQVVFTPTASGAFSGSLSVSSNATGSPHTVSLAGIGVTASPVLAWTPAVTALAFVDTAVGQAAATQTLTLANQGPGSVTLQQLTLSGTQAADFSLAAASSCAANLVLAQGASCTVVVGFQPSAAGARTATLHMASSGTNPTDVTLSGNGTATAQAALAVAPTALSFSAAGSGSTAASQTFTLSSSGSAVLRVTAIAVGTGNFAVTPAASNGCAATPFDLLPGQSCAMTVSWNGTAIGSETGSVTVESSASATPATVSLSAERTADGLVLSNEGGGGCTLAAGRSSLDPTLWLLVAAAAFVLVRRRRSAPIPSDR